MRLQLRRHVTKMFADLLIPFTTTHHLIERRIEFLLTCTLKKLPQLVLAGQNLQEQLYQLRP